MYNPLANALHGPWNLAAVRAGKHVLSEKPFASNATEAAQVAEAARAAGVTVLEGFHYWFHPGFGRVKATRRRRHARRGAPRRGGAGDAPARRRRSPLASRPRRRRGNGPGLLRDPRPAVACAVGRRRTARDLGVRRRTRRRSRHRRPPRRGARIPQRRHRIRARIDGRAGVPVHRAGDRQPRLGVRAQPAAARSRRPPHSSAHPKAPSSSTCRTSRPTPTNSRPSRRTCVPVRRSASASTTRSRTWSCSTMPTAPRVCRRDPPTALTYAA